MPNQFQLRLSICIPVYNFGQFLGETLDSIIPQITEEVEILVVDGASTDNTAEVVAHHTKNCPQLRYINLGQRGGIDVDISKSVDLAAGEYCWLFSGDDIMRPQAISRVLEMIGLECDVYVCRHTICDKNMNILWEHPSLKKYPGSYRVMEMSDPVQRNAALADAVNTESLFSFMSSLVVNRKAWLKVDPIEPFMGSCWGHVARLLEIAKTKLTVCYVDEIWLDQRSENDSFRDRGVVHRFSIAIDGFTKIATYYFGSGSTELAHVKRFLRTELSPLLFLYAWDRAIENPEVENRNELDRLFNAIYDSATPSSWPAIFIFRIMPLSVYRFLKSVYRPMRRVIKSVAGILKRSPVSSEGKV